MAVRITIEADDPSELIEKSRSIIEGVTQALIERAVHTEPRSRPRLVVRSRINTLSKSETATVVSPATKSPAGDRAVITGSSGPNYVFDAPLPQPIDYNSDLRDAMDEYVEDRAAARNESLDDAIKVGQERLQVLQSDRMAIPLPVRPWPKELIDGFRRLHETSREHAPEVRDFIERRLKQRNDAMRSSPFKILALQSDGSE